MLDAILPLRMGENEELRYAARSWAANLPHRQLVVAGGRPDWLSTEATYVKTSQRSRKYQNALLNLRRLFSMDGLTDDVILLNDDHFVVEPITEVPTLHWGPYAEWLHALERMHPRGSLYNQAAYDTASLMDRWGIENPMAYQLHIPYVVNRHAALEVLDRIAVEAVDWFEEQQARIQWLSITKNLAGAGGTQLEVDVKVYDLDSHKPWPTPFLSTSDRVFTAGAVGRYIRRLFPDPSPYEAR